MIETPPEGRRPVKTYVGEYDEELVKQALLREQQRGGQAFFLHNRVETIDETAERLRGLCPGLRFEVAHGQLDENELEQRMLSFLRGEADVLVATSIIESGIDIPQANTLIVERADLFGLAQLYQIRGRVGRSEQRAYAYLLYPVARRADRGGDEAPDARSATTPSSAPASRSRCATSRSAAPATCSATSSPATSPRSASSSTCRCSTRPSRGGRRASAADEPEPVRLDVNVDAYVPADYIPYEQAKIDVHRRIAGAREVADLRAAARRARGPLRAGARAAREPPQPPAGARSSSASPAPAPCPSAASRLDGDAGRARRPRPRRA